MIYLNPSQHILNLFHMREEGINFPDPTFDIDGNPQFDNLEIENEEEFESAFENCEDILRNALPEQFDLGPEVELYVQK